MVSNMKRFLIMVLVLVLSMGLFVMPAQAAGDYTPEVTVPVTLNLTGTLPGTPDVFSIQLKADQASFPMPSGAANGVYTLPLNAGLDAEGKPNASVSGNFVIEFNRVGIYTYTIYQLSINDEDCYQDETVYNMTVYVTNTAAYDGFETSVAIYKRGENGENVGTKGPAVFNNRYADPVEVPLTAIKTLDGKTPNDKTFSFRLKNSLGIQVERVYNDGKKVTFTPLVFDEIGEYTYKITEVTGLNRKITYDKSVYTVTIDVTKDENGDYQAEVTYEKDGKDYEGTPRFVNKTKPTGSSPVTGDMFRMGLWVSLLVLSFAGLVILVVFWFKKRKK